MSRGRKRTAGKVAPFQSLKSAPPPLDVQVRSCISAINKMAGMLGELDLMVEFTMRQFKLQRPAATGLILPGVKPQMEQLSLMELYMQQRESFAAQLTEERNAFARAQAAAQGQRGNGHDASAANGTTLDFGPEDGDEDEPEPQRES